MCGIFGYVGTRDDAAEQVLVGLKKLEYRGYDSWGIAARQNGSAFLNVLQCEGAEGSAISSNMNRAHEVLVLLKQLRQVNAA